MKPFKLDRIDHVTGGLAVRDLIGVVKELMSSCNDLDERIARFETGHYNELMRSVGRIKAILAPLDLERDFDLKRRDDLILIGAIRDAAIEIKELVGYY